MAPDGSERIVSHTDNTPGGQCESIMNGWRATEFGVTHFLNERRRTVVVVPLSTAPQAAPPLLVPVSCAGKAAVAVVDQLRAVAKERLERRLGELSPADLTSVEEALRMVLEL